MRNRLHPAVLPAALLLLLARGPADALAGSRAGADTPLPHETHVPLPLGSEAANDVRGIAVDSVRGTVWVATGAGVYRRESNPESGQWGPVAADESLAPAFAVAVPPAAAGPAGKAGTAVGWIGAWNGLHRIGASGIARLPEVPGPVVTVAVAADGTVLAGGPDGFHRVGADGSVREVKPGATRYLGRVVSGDGGQWWMATGMGLYHWNEGAGTGRYLRGPWETESIGLRDLALDGSGDAWCAALGGVQQFRSGRWRRTWTSQDGLPSADVRSIAVGPDGRLWAGTARGLAWMDGRGWRVRNGRRWLLSDDVRQVAVAADGTAWVATGAGVSVLRARPMSLAAKAAHFHGVLEARHVRPPGIVEKCALRVPGDLSTWEPMDDDNDGGYTALALAMESYRFAVTGDPAARAAARRAWEACELLQRVTGTPGFLARTVVPADWAGEVHDPNEEFGEPAWAERRAGDPRDKRVPVRWRLSADGRWRWKGDTSSDEVTAHFFGYYVFHELAADEADRRRVRDQVCRLVDHLAGHGWTLTDTDGRPTRWGVWAPERLNGDPDWAMERGINSVEILSFLKLAHHVSGDPKYAEHSRTLLGEHGYERNVLEAPNLNPAWRTYIDLELLAFAYPALLRLETDPRLLRVYRASFNRWHRTVRADGNPFFEFVAASCRGASRANLAVALEFLRETPLDLVRWDADLAAREDVAVRRRPEVEHWQTERRLPVAEIGYSRTDQNPWRASQGDGGRSESDGVFWLLPYWMGRHEGLVPR